MNNINKYIDHTALKPDVTSNEIEKIIAEAREYDFASVCVNPSWVKKVAEGLAGTTVETCTVIGFPLGSNTADVKVAETLNAIDNGATEIDMVINIGKLKEGDYSYVLKEIQAVVNAASDYIVKVIIETSLLTKEEIKKASELVAQAEAAYVKTSTGFSTGGALVEDVLIMNEASGPNVKVKASGGIRSYEDAIAMIEAGASRIGTSAGPAIMNGLTEEGSSY